MCVCLISVVWLGVSKWVLKVLRSSGRLELVVLLVVLQSVMCCGPHPPRVSSGIETIQLLSVLPFGHCDGFFQSILHSFGLCLIAQSKCKTVSMQHVMYLTVYPGPLVGKLPDLYVVVVPTILSANIRSHILSIVLSILYADRRVLKSCCLVPTFSVGRIQEQRDVVSEVRRGTAL